MKSILCFLGLHNWKGHASTYKQIGIYKRYVQGKKCIWCGKERFLK